LVDSFQLPLLFTFDAGIIDVNPFQSNFSANRILSALIYFRRERGWWITCNYPTVLKEKKRRETERVQPALSVG
jgi:hypothetical protein